jgi:hypothetical protein
MVNPEQNPWIYLPKAHDKQVGECITNEGLNETWLYGMIRI